MTYTYRIITQGNYGYCDSTETTNWQTAIDLFNEGKLRGSCEIVVYTKGSTSNTAVLRNVNDIQGWSLELMEEEKPYNRVEKRIMNEMMKQEADGMDIVETNYGEIDLPLTDDLSDTTTELDFHGDFSGMTAEVKDSIINPKHYKLFSPDDYADYPKGIEYMDLCDKALAHLSGVESHLVGQILKYALRVGKKDAMEQDATKIEWYATRLVNTVKGK
jgi:hypothetical protein